MERPRVVEILQRDGEVAAGLRMDRLPATIGRAYDCDLMLDDPYVAPHHARIELDESGLPVAVDLGSRNGLVDAATGERVERAVLDAHTTLRIGRTVLRVRDASFSVAPERIDRGRRWIERWPFAAAACMLVVLYGLYEAWVGAFGPRAAATGYVTTPLGLLALLVVWSGGWSLANRLFARHAHFNAHLSVAATGLLALLLVDAVGGQLGFVSGSRHVSSAAHLLLLVGIGALIFAHLALIRPLRLRRMAMVGFSLTAVLIGLDMFRNYQGRGILIDVPFMTTLSYPGLRAVQPGTLDTFLQRAAALKPDIDRLRNDRGRDDGDDGESED